jgi:phage gpG-like protein
MGLGFTVGTRGLKSMAQAIAKFGRLAGDTAKLNKLRVAVADKLIERNFQREGFFAGGWVELRPQTRREKARIGKQKKLQRTGNLKNNRTLKASAREASITFDEPYASTHHFGDKERKIPSRPLFVKRSEWEKEDAKVVKKFAQSIKRKTGL